jgi:hypothetical protein
MVMSNQQQHGYGLLRDNPRHTLRETEENHKDSVRIAYVRAGVTPPIVPEKIPLVGVDVIF